MAWSHRRAREGSHVAEGFGLSEAHLEDGAGLGGSV